MPEFTVEACLLREIFIRYSSLLIMYTYAYTPMSRPLNPKILFQFLRHQIPLVRPQGLRWPWVLGRAARVSFLRTCRHLVGSWFRAMTVPREPNTP